jgi:hypothetical protein
MKYLQVPRSIGREARHSALYTMSPAAIVAINYWPIPSCFMYVALSHNRYFSIITPSFQCPTVHIQRSGKRRYRGKSAPEQDPVKLSGHSVFGCFFPFGQISHCARVVLVVV